MKLFKRQMVQYHPDRLAASDASNEDIEAAAEKFERAKTKYEDLAAELAADGGTEHRARGRTVRAQP